MKLCQLIDIIFMGNISWKTFASFERLGPNFRPFLNYQPTGTNQKRIMMNF